MDLKEYNGQTISYNKKHPEEREEKGNGQIFRVE